MFITANLRANENCRYRQQDDFPGIMPLAEESSEGRTEQANTEDQWDDGNHGQWISVVVGEKRKSPVRSKPAELFGGFGDTHAAHPISYDAGKGRHEPALPQSDAGLHEAVVNTATPRHHPLRSPPAEANSTLMPCSGAAHPSSPTSPTPATLPMSPRRSPTSPTASPGSRTAR